MRWARAVAWRPTNWSPGSASGSLIWPGISTPAIAGDWIFTLTDDAKLLCIARATGKVRWSTQLAHYVNTQKKKEPIFWTGPVLAGNRLWVANSRGEVFAVGADEGTAHLFKQLESPITLAPVVANCNALRAGG